MAHCMWAYDKLGNAALSGDSRETISSRLGKTRYGGNPVFGCKAVDNTVIHMLNEVEKDHCEKRN